MSCAERGRALPWRPPCGGWPPNRRLQIGDVYNHVHDDALHARIASIEILNPGSGYTTATVELQPQQPGEITGNGAVLVPIIRDGQIIEIKVLYGGYGYLTPPAVVINGDGTGAQAIAHLAGYDEYQIVAPDNTFATPATYPCNVPCANPPDGNCLPRRTQEECAGSDVYAEGHCWRKTGRKVEFGAYYDAVEQKWKPLCHRWGWKAFAAIKTWHGRFGFLQEFGPNQIISHKYQAISVSISLDILQQWETASFESHVSAVANGYVNQASGCTLTGGGITSHEIWTDSSGTTERINDPSEGLWALLTILIGFDHLKPGGFGWAQRIWRAPGPYMYGPFVLENVPSAGPYATWPTGQTVTEFEQSAMENTEWLVGVSSRSVSVGLSDDMISFELAGSGDGLTVELTVIVQLSDKITASQFLAWAYSQADSWNLADDALYPWRQDGNCMTIPLVEWDEAPTPVAPVPDWGESAGGCSHTGIARGKPLPPGYGPVAAFTSLDPQDLCHVWTPWVLPQNATWWKTWREGNETSGGTVQWYNGRVFIRYYAETKELHKSHNFARPCGADRNAIDMRDVAYALTYGPGITYCHSLNDPATYPPVYRFRNGNTPDYQTANKSTRTAFPICGWIDVEASWAGQGGNTTVLKLCRSPDALEVGDQVVIEERPALQGAYTVLAINGDEIEINATWSDPQGGPEGAIHSPGAPARHWDDDRSKGEFVISTIEEYQQWNEAQQQYELQQIISKETRCITHSNCSPVVLTFTPPREGLDFRVKFRFWQDVPIKLFVNEAWSFNIRFVQAVPDEYWQPEPFYDEACNFLGFVSGPPPSVEAYSQLPNGAPQPPLDWSNLNELGEPQPFALGCIGNTPWDCLPNPTDCWQWPFEGNEMWV